MESESQHKRIIGSVRTTRARLTNGDPTHVRPGLPARIGRYRVERLLGHGAFGVVFLAHDEQLDRRVAIKVPHARRFSDQAQAELYLNEARMVASLDHPRIVPVYDIGSSDEFPCFVVSKYIEGRNLWWAMRENPFATRKAAEVVAHVAEALHHAHLHGVVHRDVKPGNILLDASGQPFVVDFGVALRDQDVETADGYAGTPAYMSPEQARGEGHRVDGRSDVFSLGVILYELLTGRRPFTGYMLSSLLNDAATLDPKPPRQISDGIPRELERICLRAIAKRASDRYTTAGDLAEDLWHFLQSTGGNGPQPMALHEGSAPPANPPPTTRVGTRPDSTGKTTPPTGEAAIVPKGLRAFDEHDADFFLELLPGPRDRMGLPESLRFWKAQLEERSPDRTFSVGLIYGPSGCGKSSLVRAGLLPRLEPGILTILVEATPDDTEERLLGVLQKRCSAAASARSLRETLAALRRQRAADGEDKVLLVLDQFEQWLHARGEETGGELVEALRQCDGTNVQCLVLVRDDFYVAVNRFFQELEISIREGHNYALVDLFDLDHARKVLTAFGRAYGKLPEPPSRLMAEQDEFLVRAMAALAQDGKVISIRLALFAEMMKGRPWTVESLEAIGGAEGVGVTFLDETFSAATAPPTHRLHERAAQAVLQLLLPPAGNDLKGHRQSVERLREASGYADRPREFRSLLLLLEQDTRLIAPTEAGTSADDETPTGRREYQLTHDFLVPAIRDWLSRQQRASRRGRAQFRLAERTALWSSKPERKQLPTFGEWLRIRMLTRPSTWTGPQRRMMSLAMRHYLGRALMAAVVLVALAAIGLAARHRAAAETERRRLDNLVKQLWSIEFQRIPTLLDQIGPLSPERRAWIQRVSEDPDSPADQRTRAQLALARQSDGGPDDLRERLLVANPDEMSVLVDELRPWRDTLVAELWREALSGRLQPDRLLHAAAVLAEYDPHSSRWSDVCFETAEALAAQDPLRAAVWSEALEPVRIVLRDGLERIVRNRAAADSHRHLAASILARYASIDLLYLPAERLSQLLLDASPAQHAILTPLARGHRRDVSEFMSKVLGETPPIRGDASEEQVRRQANAALTLFSLDQEKPFWDGLRQREDPRLRTLLIEHIQPARIEWERLLARLAIEEDGTARQAIVLGLDAYRDDVPTGRNSVVERLVMLYEQDPHPGVHSAAEWLLERWGSAGDVQRIKQELAGAPREDRGWFINGEGQTMLVVGVPGTFRVGSPPDEPFRDASESLREVTLDYTLCVGAHEVTEGEFRRFRSERPTGAGEEARLPANFVSWYDAAAYCRWLGEREGISPQEQCYPPLIEIGPDMELPENHARRTGYRLLSEEEWEYCARAGSVTSHFCGNTGAAPLEKHAWYGVNSFEWVHPVGELRPNPFGLFDVYGNVTEWCDVSATPRQADRQELRGGSYRSTPRFLRSAMPEGYLPDTSLSFVGFRLARVLAVPTASNPGGE